MEKHLILESVIGISIQSPFSVQSLDHETILYAAGATLVFFNTATQKQSFHLTAPSSPKSISSISISMDGKLIILGESGHQPRILMYDVETQAWLNPLLGHKAEIMSAQFSPDMKYVVSIGCHLDGFLYIWDWRTGLKLFGSKLTSRVFSLSFHADSEYFVTAGVKQIKLWDLKKITNNELQGRDAVFEEHKNAIIVDSACFCDFIYAITSDGYLLMFNEMGILEKWLNTKMNRGTCIYVNSNVVICGGSEGKLRLFQPGTLSHLSNAPKLDSWQVQQSLNKFKFY